MGWEGMEGSRPPEARPPKREAEPKPGKPKEYVGQHVLVGTYCYCVVQCIEHVHDHVLLTPLRCGAGLRAVLHAYCPSRVAPSMYYEYEYSSYAGTKHKAEPVTVNG